MRVLQTRALNHLATGTCFGEVFPKFSWPREQLLYLPKNRLRVTGNESVGLPCVGSSPDPDTTAFYAVVLFTGFLRLVSQTGQSLGTGFLLRLDEPKNLLFGGFFHELTIAFSFRGSKPGNRLL